MTTDTSEQGLERLICTALAGDPCDPPKADSVQDVRGSYGGVGWRGGSWLDYDRDHCVDLIQLTGFVRDTQPKVADSVGLSEDGPVRRNFLARLQGEISKRGTINVLRHGVSHGPLSPTAMDTRFPSMRLAPEGGARPALIRPSLAHNATLPQPSHPSQIGDRVLNQRR